MRAYTSKGPEHSLNQDSYTVLEGGRVRAYMVCDGHGDDGEIVSRAVARRLPSKILASLISDAPDAPFSAETSSAALRRAILGVDEWVYKKIPQSRGSGCTAAGVIYDTAGRRAHAFSVGDSLVYCVAPDGTRTALQLQNASHMPKDVRDELFDAQWRMGKSLYGKIGGSAYMMFPGSAESGLQLYSTIGDFDLKEVNPVVRARPLAVRLGPLARGTRILVASDGYLEGFPMIKKSRWMDAVGDEIDRSAEFSARDMVEMAISRGSRDDITAIAIEV